MTQPITTYEQAIEFLFGRINYERAHGSSYSARDFKLDRMGQLLERLGNPQNRVPAVHVAGTKGKGSTAAMAAGMLSAAGYRVGLFTSPHVSAFEERMTVAGVRPEPSALVDLVNRVIEPVAALDAEPGRMSPTYFEIATALGWLYFTDQQAEIAVLEVGMGGRLDATNICRPEVSVITSISRDHTAFLGNTLGKIAAEKAGIIKPGVPVVSGATGSEAQAVIAEKARAVGAPLYQLGRDVHYRVLRPAAGGVEGSHGPFAPASLQVETFARRWPGLVLPLVGDHQAANAALAAAAIDVLTERGWKVPMERAQEGLASVRWPLRFEVLRQQPILVVDAAHNWASVRALVDTLNAAPSAGGRRVLIFSGTKDKDVAGLLRLLLPQFDTIILTQYQSNPRALELRDLQRLAGAICDYPTHTAPDPSSAWRLASRLAGPNDLICATGSFFIAAETREIVLDEQRVPRTGEEPAARRPEPTR